MAEAQTQAVVAPETIKSMLASPLIRAKFEEVLGARTPAFVSSVVSAVSSNKALSECTPMSVISSAMIAASMDLPINASLGFAYIVPYRNKGVAEAQFQIGAKGFIQLAIRSGQYKTIHVSSILEGQLIEYNPFTGDIKLDANGAKSEKRIGYLLYFRLLSGYEKYFYMTTERVTAHGKKFSKSFQKGFGQWVDDFESMALKTVVKLGLSKYGVLSVDMQKAIEVDQSVPDEEGEPKYVDADQLPSEVEPARIKATVPKATAARSEDQSQAAAPEPGSFDAFQGGPPPGAKTQSKAEVAYAIGIVGQRLGMNHKAIEEYAVKHFEKAVKAMTVVEMQDLLLRLDNDLKMTGVK